MVDLRQLAIAKLWADYYKKVNNESTKEAIRKHEAIKFADYATITLGKQTTSYYSEEDQAKIDKFIKENKIEKITETKEEYKVIINPSEKAKKEFDKMINELENSQYRNIAKVASQVKSKA